MTNRNAGNKVLKWSFFLVFATAVALPFIGALLLFWPFVAFGLLLVAVQRIGGRRGEQLGQVLFIAACLAVVGYGVWLSWGQLIALHPAGAILSLVLACGAAALNHDAAEARQKRRALTGDDLPPGWLEGRYSRPAWWD
jgi:hypothetical protein